MSYSRELRQLTLDERVFSRTWKALHTGVYGESASLSRPSLDGIEAGESSESALSSSHKSKSAVAPGMVAGYWQAQQPRVFHAACLGSRSLLPQKEELFVDTVFDLASLSKVIGTTTLVATLVDRGWLSFDLRVQSILSDFPYKEICIKHLLSHTSGLPWWRPFYEDIRQILDSGAIWERPVSERQKLMRDLVFRVEPQCQVDQQVEYSDLNFMILGFLLEDLLGLPLDEAVASHVFERMGMEGAFYRRTVRSPEKARLPRVAATEDCPWRGAVLQGLVHDDNCYAMGGYGGHTGIFGSMRDVVQFVRCLFEGFLTPETLRAIWTPYSKPKGCERTLGWDTPSLRGPSSLGHYFSPHSVGHLGFTGCSLWIDIPAGLAVVLLTNRVHPSRDNDQIKQFRPLFHDAIRQDLMDLS